MKEPVECGSCSTCPKKMGVRDIIKVAALHGIQVGQEVMLEDTTNWFTRNKILFALLSFVAGIIWTELLTMIISFGAYHTAADLFGGGLTMMALLIVLWIKRQKYLFRIKMIEGE